MTIAHVLANKVQMEQLRAIHVQLYTVLQKSVRLFDKFNINYSIAAGNVIGYLRNREIILWDDDVDIIILDTELSKLTSSEFIHDCVEMGMSLIYEKDMAFHIVNEPAPSGYQELSIDQYHGADNMYKKPIIGSSNQLDVFIYKQYGKMCDHCQGPWFEPVLHENMVNTRKVQFGPVEVRLMGDAIAYTRNNYSSAGTMYIISHLHSPESRKIFNFPLPYWLSAEEVDLVKNFKFDIQKEELNL